MESGNITQETIPNQQFPQPISEQPKKQRGFLLPITGVILLVLVIAGAYYLGINKSSTTTSNNQTTPTATPITSGTASWKTYLNEKYSYIVKYPNDWLINEYNTELRSIVLLPNNEDPNIPPGMIRVEIYASTKPFSDYPRGNSESEPQEIVDWKEIEVNGVKGISYRRVNCVPLCDRVMVLPIKNSNPLVISVSTNIDNKIIDQIFSNFRFLATDATGNAYEWITYKNEKYQFSFSYPKDHTPFERAIFGANPDLIPATTMSDTVEIATNETSLFCCEPGTLSFSVKSTNKSPRERVEEYLRSVRDWEQELPAVKDTTFAGKPAVQARGRGGYGPPTRLIAIQLNNSVLIINQNIDEPLLAKILSTVKFTK